MSRIIQRSYSHQIFEALMASGGTHPVFARLYAARGVEQQESLATDLKGLIPPSLLLHANKAASYLADAILERKKLVIVADYDCDGATACAVGIRGLARMGAQIDYCVPNRFEYGYGLTPEIVELTVKEKQPDIIITVDNGIASVDGVEHARSLGVEVLITDHHLPGADLPDAKVIVNPNQPGCLFPSKCLAGVGVMFYVLLALRAELRQRGVFDASNQPKLDDLLDLVALGTIADLVKLDANNRILVAQGLKRMRLGLMQPGVAALFAVAGREPQQAKVNDLGFALGPRLNAAGRLADMSLGIECLITDDKNQALEIARQLDQMNKERRDIQTDMQATAMLVIDEGLSPQHNATLCVFDASWHPGVIGIVAARLKEKFYRPTITFAPSDNGVLKGSGRSIAGFHLRDALDLVSKQAPELICSFGGHAMAAGLTIPEDALDAFREAFEAVGQSWLSESDLAQKVETDGSLETEYFTTQFIALLDDQVWGQGFAPPLFCDAFNVVEQRILKEKHLKLKLERAGQYFDAVYFGETQYLSESSRIAYRLDINAYKGREQVQLLVQYAEAL
ncbi:MAG: single-stranded-DNA-specific exonuclease RecJ [Pseudomonadota bacterium]